MPYANVIFDLDGTLVDSRADIIIAMQKTLADLGLDEIGDVDDEIGSSRLRELIDKYLPRITQSHRTKILTNFEKNYEQSTFENTRPYPGIPKLLKNLYVDGIILFIATYKRKVPTRKILNGLRLDQYFCDVFTPDSGDGYANKSDMLAEIIYKYDLNPARTVMVGDTKADAKAARDSGIDFAHVEWGYGTVSNANHRLKTIDELDHII